jgi:hypothetical protein
MVDTNSLLCTGANPGLVEPVVRPTSRDGAGPSSLAAHSERTSRRGLNLACRGHFHLVSSQQ